MPQEQNEELERARTQARLYRTLAAASHAAMRADTADEVYAGLCRAAARDGGFILAWIGVPDGSGRIRPRHAEGDEAARRGLEEAPISCDPSLGATSSAWSSGRTAVVRDVTDDARARPWSERAGALGLRASLGLPIRQGGRVVAVLTICARTPGFFSPEIVALAETVAQEAEFALDNLVLAEKVDRMGAALRESRRLLSEVLDTLPAACYVLDEGERRFVFASRGMGNTTDFSPAEIVRLGTKAVEIMHPDDFAANRPFERHQELADGEIWEWEARLRGADGSWRWHRMREIVFERGEDGRVKRVLGSCEDVTERVELAAGFRRIAGAVEAAAESVVITDAKGIIVYVNPAFERASGWTRAEALGRHTRELKSGAQTPEFYRALWGTISAGNIWTGHFVNRRKDGTVYEEDASISPIRDGQGRIVNYVAVKRDVTRELRLERELRQAQKLEAVGRLAGGVAHDFNNILTAILGSAELIAAQLPEKSPLSPDVEEIQRSGRRAADLTRQLLIFSRRQVVAPRLLEPARVVADLQKMLRRIVGEDLSLSFADRADGARIEIDPGHLEQVVMNFVVNARDATLPGGSIAVDLRRESVAEPIDGVDGPVPPGDYAVLAVRDTGSGIPPEVLPRVFEPFFTTKPAGVGTGLGLSTVYGIVTQSRGRLAVDTAPGRGTTMSVYWPVASGPADAPAAAPAPPARGGSERILLVEDEAPVRRLVERVLAQDGYRVLAARDAREALALAGEREFDLLLTDVVLPGGMDGKDLAAAALEAQPALKLLYASGYSGDSIAGRGILDPGARLLRKPFTREVLLRAVRGALDGTGEALS
ncbi:MAG: PAS domain S-box protein [Elusimicrobia bacterium]|nr:PAS domain S-box protein [Elusimicrobiota bacterium]